MDDFLRRLAPRPSDYGGLPGKITREDDAGNVYDETGRRIFNKFDQTEQPDSWLDTAISTATAPAKLATGLAGSLNPYGQDGWQVPPIISEPAAAFARSGELTGFGDDGQFYLPNVQNPQVAQDTLTQLMTVYGGNALNPLARVPKGGLASGAVKKIGPGPEPGAVIPKAEAMGFSDVPAENPSKAAEDAYVKAYRADLEANKYRYFNDWTEDPDAPLVVDDWGRQISGGSEISELFDNATPYGYRALKETHPAVAEGLNAAAAAVGRDLTLAPSANSGSLYGTLRTPSGAQYKVRVADHGNLSSKFDAPDYNIAPGGMTPEEFARLMPTLLSDNRPSLMGSALASQADALPMDQASRLQRARDMGFDTDTTWYHGTTSDFPAFSLSPYGKGSDSFGVHLGTKNQAQDIIKSNTSMEKKHYGEFKPDSKVMPLHVRSGNLLELPDLGQGNTWDIGALRYEMAVRGIPEKLKDPFNPTLADIRASLQDAGYDGIRYQNNFEGVRSDGPQDSIMLFDPSNIRSVNAAFDPARAGENGLLLSDNKPSLLGSALASGQGEEDLLTLLGYR